MHASAAQAPALQARVLELTAERDVLESERDALRAQVEMVRPLVASATRHDMKPSLRSKILDTLSAPPAEATPAPERDPRFQCSVHPDCFGDSEYCTKRK